MNIMNRILTISFVCITLAACTKTIEEPFHFEKGQQMTFTVGTGSDTKVSSSISGSDVNFTWSTGDKIKVTVGKQSSEFTLVTGNGESTATFSGTMPASGSTFDVQYPYDEPDLTKQDQYYVKGSLPQVYKSASSEKYIAMLFKATNCSSSNLDLIPQFSGIKFSVGAQSGTHVLDYMCVKVDGSDRYLRFITSETAQISNTTPIEVYIIIPIDCEVKEVTINEIRVYIYPSGSGSASNLSKVVTLKRGHITTIGGAKTIAISGGEKPE